MNEELETKYGERDQEEMPISITVPGYGKMKVKEVETSENGTKQYKCAARIKSRTVLMDVFTWPNGGFEVYEHTSTVPYLVCDESKVTEHYKEVKK